MAKYKTMIWLGILTVPGCQSPSGSVGGESQVTLASGNAITDVPAVDRDLYPDNIGYVYQGPLADILWLQNEPRAVGVDELMQSMRRGMARGVAGEILNSRMQHVDRMPDTQPTLPQMSKGAVQSVRQMTQYAFVTADYSDALGTALASYNADPARQQAIADTATRLDDELDASVTPNPAHPLPGGAPPLSQRLLKPGTFLSDAVRKHTLARLARRAAQLEAAIAAREIAAYADAFTDVFLMQRDLVLTRGAVEALAAHHADGLLRGQPLDLVIATYVTVVPAPDRRFSVEQLSLINQINLLAGAPSAPRTALVAALLLIDEDHRQGEQDGAISCSQILQHVTDTTWLVSQLVRLKADGTTVAGVNAMLASIVASI